jgi:multidrug efflux pump subunit AcrA (membrane-fusion protein)
MSAVAHLAVRQSKDVLTVPAAALVTANGSDAVWRVVDGKAVQTPVRLGVQGTDEVEVVSGLNAGDQIVVVGADRVHTGQRVP